jgi:hypothetical protein
VRPLDTTLVTVPPTAVAVPPKVPPTVPPGATSRNKNMQLSTAGLAQPPVGGHYAAVNSSSAGGAVIKRMGHVLMPPCHLAGQSDSSSIASWLTNIQSSPAQAGEPRV